MSAPKAEQPSLTAMTVQEAAKLASQMQPGGMVINENHIRADIAAGAPANPDGTLNIATYTAWMVKQGLSRW